MTSQYNERIQGPKGEVTSGFELDDPKPAPYRGSSWTKNTDYDQYFANDWKDISKDLEKRAKAAGYKGDEVQVIKNIWAYKHFGLGASVAQGKKELAAMSGKESLDVNGFVDSLGSTYIGVGEPPKLAIGDPFSARALLRKNNDTEFFNLWKIHNTRDFDYNNAQDRMLKANYDLAFTAQVWDNTELLEHTKKFFHGTGDKPAVGTKWLYDNVGSAWNGAPQNIRVAWNAYAQDSSWGKFSSSDLMSQDQYVDLLTSGFMSRFADAEGRGFDDVRHPEDRLLWEQFAGVMKIKFEAERGNTLAQEQLSSGFLDNLISTRPWMGDLVNTVGTHSEELETSVLTGTPLSKSVGADLATPKVAGEPLKSSAKSMRIRGILKDRFNISNDGTAALNSSLINDYDVNVELAATEQEGYFDATWDASIQMAKSYQETGVLVPYHMAKQQFNSKIQPFRQILSKPHFDALVNSFDVEYAGYTSAMQNQTLAGQYEFGKYFDDFTSPFLLEQVNKDYKDELKLTSDDEMEQILMRATMSPFARKLMNMGFTDANQMDLIEKSMGVQSLETVADYEARMDTLSSSLAKNKNISEEPLRNLIYAHLDPNYTSARVSLGALGPGTINTEAMKNTPINQIVAMQGRNKSNALSDLLYNAPLPLGQAPPDSENAILQKMERHIQTLPQEQRYAARISVSRAIPDILNEYYAVQQEDVAAYDSGSVTKLPEMLNWASGAALKSKYSNVNPDTFDQYLKTGDEALLDKAAEESRMASGALPDQFDAEGFKKDIKNIQKSAAMEFATIMPDIANKAKGNPRTFGTFLDTYDFSKLITSGTSGTSSPAAPSAPAPRQFFKGSVR